jgi:hypothetical protein
MTCCVLETSKRQMTKTKTDAHMPCDRCGEQSKPVSRKTVALMLKPQLLEEALNGNFRFCATRECPIVYFAEQGARIFSVEDLRTVVGIKASTDPILLCYCFGFEECHLREEISQTGSTTIPKRISQLIHEGLCACDLRNPSGACCLGEVNKTVTRLKQAVHQ